MSGRTWQQTEASKIEPRPGFEFEVQTIFNRWNSQEFNDFLLHTCEWCEGFFGPGIAARYMINGEIAPTPSNEEFNWIYWTFASDDTAYINFAFKRETDMVVFVATQSG